MGVQYKPRDSEVFYLSFRAWMNDNIVHHEQNRAIYQAQGQAGPQK